MNPWLWAALVAVAFGLGRWSRRGWIRQLQEDAHLLRCQIDRMRMEERIAEAMATAETPTPPAAEPDLWEVRERRIARMNGW